MLQLSRIFVAERLDGQIVEPTTIVGKYGTVPTSQHNHIANLRPLDLEHLQYDLAHGKINSGHGEDLVPNIKLYRWRSNQRHRLS